MLVTGAGVSSVGTGKEVESGAVGAASVEKLVEDGGGDAQPTSRDKRSVRVAVISSGLACFFSRSSFRAPDPPVWDLLLLHQE